MKTLHVQTVWLEQIKNRRKTIEGRTGNTTKFQDWVGEVAIFTDGNLRVPVIIRKVKHYNTLDEYIDACGWENVAPHLNSRAETIIAYLAIVDSEGVQVFSPQQIARRGGICALHTIYTEVL